MNDLWNIAARMAEELEDIADIQRQAGYLLMSIERLLVQFEDYALKHAPTDGRPVCFAEDLVALIPMAREHEHHPRSAALLAQKEASGMASTSAVKQRRRVLEAVKLLWYEGGEARRDARSADADAAERMRISLMAGLSLLIEDDQEIDNNDDR